MHTETNCKSLKTELLKLNNHAVSNQQLQLDFLTKHTCKHNFPPFCLFSEVACPLSKVCIAKGRVHFHIFPFDMRRHFVGLCFLFPVSCLSMSSSLFSFSSCCSAHSHFPGHCSLRGEVGGPRKM